MKDFNEILKDTIRVKREQKRLSKTELAAKLEYSGSSIVSEWENGNKQPSLAAIVKMAELFQCSVDEMLFGRPENFASEPKGVYSRENNFNDEVLKVVDLINQEREMTEKRLRQDFKEILAEKSSHIRSLQGQLDIVNRELEMCLHGKLQETGS